jgi:predicted ATP-grasp superfamily ATP-dependent carboligase/peptidoglycan/xylan/chitin deacetylase (PgdA/CDA1 family)
MSQHSVPHAVVLGGGHNGLGVIRSLGRAGVEVLAVHTNGLDPALQSRFCAPVIPPCDPAVDENKYVEFLMGLSSPGASAPALIPTGDAEVAAVSRYRSRLEKRFRFVMAEHDVIESLIDKRLFSELAAGHGLPTPQTYEAADETRLEALSREIVYPCVIKPMRSRAWGNAAFQRRFGGDAGGWIKRVIAPTRAELLCIYPELAAFDKNLVLQEYIEGGDDALYDFYSYLDENSEPLGCFMIRKRRTLPIDGNGIGTCVESVWDEALAMTSLRFLKAIRFRGNSAVCFKRCGRTGRFYVIEVNARLALHHALAAHCGVDLSYMAYRDAIGERPPRATPARRKVLWLSFWDDLAAFRRYRERGDLTLRTWVGSLRGEKAHCFLAWDDLRPFTLKSAEALAVGTIGRDRARALRRSARRWALRAKTYSGFFWAATRFQRRRENSGVLILLYHSIGRPGALQPDLCVSEKNFARQLEYLARHFEVVTLERAAEMIARGEAPPKNAVAITFDDGYRDNYATAFPLLKRYGLSATIFVSTAPLAERRPLWPNRLFTWFENTRVRSARLPVTTTGEGSVVFELATPAERDAARRAAETLLRRADNAAREKLLGQIAAALGCAADGVAGGPAMLEWDQLEEMAAAGITIASHTVSHPALAALEREEALAELTLSKAALEARLKRRVTLFAYPFGQTEDFNAETQALVREAGYQAACSAIAEVNRASADPLALARLAVGNDPPSAFAFQLQRVWG